jgi:hypothetical protein
MVRTDTHGAGQVREFGLSSLMIHDPFERIGDQLEI